MNTQTNAQTDLVKQAIRLHASDPSQSKVRYDVAIFASQVFLEVGNQIYATGHIFGSDRKDGKSPFGHGSDEAVGVSVLLRIANQLVAAAADLLTSGRPYAGAALLRQLVEVEYLAWAFETRDGDAERWLRSDREIREDFFRPAKLRQAAQGKFRSKDYGYHCEFGGHPVPGAGVLLSEDEATQQLLLSDLNGHAGRIWDHLVGWAYKNDIHGTFILNKSDEMLLRFQEWKRIDQLSGLPAPP